MRVRVRSWFRHPFIAALLGALVATSLPSAIAAVGDAMVIGEVNIGNARTRMTGRNDSSILQVVNRGTGTALDLRVKGNRAPLRVNSSKVVPNLNADQVDGMEASAFLGVGAKATDADKLDGQDSTEFLGATDTAADADLVDGMDSTEFLTPAGVVAAHAGGDQSEWVTTTDEVVRSVSLTAPSAGTVIVTSTANAYEITAGEAVWCSITTGTEIDVYFLQVWESGSDGSTGQLAGTRGFNVESGLFTANLVCVAHLGGGNEASDIFDSAMTAIFIPD